jgi:enoyl-CoA hydratase/carnithine racemase
MSDQQSPVRLIRHDGWAEVALSRPERKNAIDGPLGVALAAALEAASADHTIRVILLRGEGGAFCSGLDLKAFNADPAPAWVTEFPRIWRSAHRALFDCRVPIVGALERYAINGGAALALACDLLVSGETAWLQVGEARLGMAAPYNLAWATLRLPESVTARLVFLADQVPGAELRRLGIAHQVVPDAEVLQTATTICETLAAWPADGLPRLKRGLRAGLGVAADAWFDRFSEPGAGPIRPPPGPVRA